MTVESLRRQAARGATPAEVAAAAVGLLGGTPEALFDNPAREMAVRVACGTVVHGGRATGGVARMRGTRLLAALLLALPGDGVHLVTPTEDLALAEAAAARESYGPLGLTVGVLHADLTPEELRTAYAADVTVGSYERFGIDRLRDTQATESTPRARRAAPAAVVLDTAHVLLENLDNHAALWESGPARPDELRAAARHAAVMVEGRDYTAPAENRGLPRITARGRAALHDAFGVVRPAAINAVLLEKRIAEALLAAAARRGEDYDVLGDRVVHRESGRLPFALGFTGGLRQAVEIREGVPVTEVTRLTATTSVLGYFAGYRLVGGTAHGEVLRADHLTELFGLRVWDRRTPEEAEVERAHAEDLDRHLSVARTLARWDAVGERHRAGYLALRERSWDRAGLAAVCHELTGRHVTGTEPGLRAGLHSGLDRTLAYLNAAEAYEWSVHWPDELSEHERALADLGDALRVSLRTELVGKLEERI